MEPSTCVWQGRSSCRSSNAQKGCQGVHKAAPHKYSIGNAWKSAVVRRVVFSPISQCMQLADFSRIFLHSKELTQSQYGHSTKHQWKITTQMLKFYRSKSVKPIFKSDRSWRLIADVIKRTCVKPFFVCPQLHRQWSCTSVLSLETRPLFLWLFVWHILLIQINPTGLFPLPVVFWHYSLMLF